MVPLYGTPTAAGTSAGTAASQVVALNAGTTYGRDNSAANNYGFGKGYVSPLRRAQAQKQQDAAPSAWWAIGFFLLGAVLL